MPGLVKISEAASLALHTMVLLAKQREQRFTNQAIAAKLAVSVHHLAKVMPRLAKAGLVQSQPGPNGGFSLGQPADKICLREIYEVIEGPVSGGCLLKKPICHGSPCALGGLVHGIHEQIGVFMARTSLAEFSQGVSL